MAKVYYDKDADISLLKGKKVAIVGYGIKGRGQRIHVKIFPVKLVHKNFPFKDVCLIKLPF